VSEWVCACAGGEESTLTVESMNILGKVGEERVVGLELEVDEGAEVTLEGRGACDSGGVGEGNPGGAGRRGAGDHGGVQVHDEEAGGALDGALEGMGVGRGGVKLPAKEGLEVVVMEGGAGGGV